MKMEKTVIGPSGKSYILRRHKSGVTSYHNAGFISDDGGKTFSTYSPENMAHFNRGEKLDFWTSCHRWLRGLEDIEEAKELINHPEHYNVHPSGVECIDIVEHFTFNIGNSVKYVWRSGLKILASDNGNAARIQDLKKARWYLDREIARLEKEAS